MVKACLLAARAALLFSLLTVAAHAESLACPPSITVREELAEQVSEPWSAANDRTPRQLGGAAFFDGPPENLISLAPTKDFPSSGKNRVAEWQFGSGGGPIWLSCRYIDTGMTLSRPLPGRYHTCRISYGPGGIINSIDCR